MPDINYHDSLADTDGMRLSDRTIDPRTEGKPLSMFSDTLKLSNTHNFVGTRLDIVGSNENAVDMNRTCKNVVLSNCQLRGGGQCAVVIKGGSSQITLQDIEIYEVRGSYDIELGGWSDQSQEITREVALVNVRRLDGEPVRVVIGNAEKPLVVGGNVKILTLQSWLLKVYIVLKRVFPFI